MTVNLSELGSPLVELIRAVEKGEVIVIVRDGVPVAELRARPRSAVNRLATHPELQGKILYDPTELATEEDWPEDAR